jgi:catechol 2,3-dioxygenase-like lactoylglutathione lyase family enzyme
MPQVTLHHVHHEAADVDIAAAFYVDNFEAHITERVEREGVQWARVSIGGSMLNITDREHAQATQGPHRGLDHIGIHTTDFDATVATLRRNGVVFYVEPFSPRPGAQIAFVTGPDNVKVEVLCLTPA